VYWRCMVMKSGKCASDRKASALAALTWEQRCEIAAVQIERLSSTTRKWAGSSLAALLTAA